MESGKSKGSFLGRGWSFPPQFSKSSKSVELVADEEDIRQSLSILLSTSIGERIMQPDYGCDLGFMLFDKLTTTTETSIKDLIETAILYHEPRIDLENVTLRPDGDQDGMILIDIDYTIRSTNTRNNMVYPYYFNEGTDVDL